MNIYVHAYIDYYQFFSIKHVFCVRKRNYVFIDSI